MKEGLLKKKSIKDSSVGQKNWFGGGLYEFLEDQDIVFDLFKDNYSEKLTKDNFKTIPLKDLTAIVKVSISENSNQLKTSESGRVKIEHLKALHGGNDWTWSCHIKFSSIANSTTISHYELEDKDKFFNDQENEFFNILVKDLAEENNEKGSKKNLLKIVRILPKETKNQKVV